MNREEWARYEAYKEVAPVIRGSDFTPPHESVGMLLLCRGYHANGGSNIRIWLRFDGMIGLQHDDREIVFRSWWSTGSLYPSKRVYREDTTLRFAMLMRERHEYPLSFTSWRT